MFPNRFKVYEKKSVTFKLTNFFYTHYNFVCLLCLKQNNNLTCDRIVAIMNVA